MHIVICTGGYLDIEFAKKYLKTLSYDKVFAVDKGLEYVNELNICPDYIVGDFDTVNIDLLKKYEYSIYENKIPSCIEKHPPEKNATDTELALDKAMKDGAKKITILGATGTRMDHVLANISLLLQTDKTGIACYIVDKTNRIRLLSTTNNKCRIEKETQYGNYLSLIALDSKVEGVTLKGVKYPIQNRTIYQGSSLTVSNEILEQEAFIEIKKGNVLVIESKDK